MKGVWLIGVGVAAGVVGYAHYLQTDLQKNQWGVWGNPCWGLGEAWGCLLDGGSLGGGVLPVTLGVTLGVWTLGVVGEGLVG